MKILLFTHYYEPELGAPQRRWSGFISRWQKAGHQVTVYCPSPHYPDKKSTACLRTRANKLWTTETGRYGEVIHRMPYLLHGYSGGVRLADQFVTALVSTLASLWKERKNNHDVVISTIPGLPSAFAAQFFADRRKIPHVLDLRDAWPDILVGEAEDTTDYSLPEKLTTLVKATGARALAKSVRRVQRRADMLVTTTHSFKRILEHRGLRHVETVTNGADSTELASSIEQPEEPHKTLRVQYLGTVGRSQGLLVFLRALKLLKERGLDNLLEARIIGEGADLPHLKHYAEKQNIEIRFLPPARKKDLAGAYAWADAHLVSLRPAKVFEWTVPSKIFELIATRRRIIGMVDGEASRLIQRTRSGVVLEPGNAEALADELADMVENPQHRLVNSEALEILNEKYSYDVLAEKYLDIISRTARHSPKAR